jgi:hypothetical protein
MHWPAAAGKPEAAAAPHLNQMLHIDRKIDTPVTVVLTQ